MKLTFFNHYGYGDLFESREFVRDWMRVCGVTGADYAHRECPNFFEDLPGIRSVPMRDELNMRVGWMRPARAEDELWVNTWIGCRNGATQPPGDYVVWPGIGCTVEHLHRMHNDYMLEAGLPGLPRAVADYLPVIDYSKVRLARPLLDEVTRLHALKLKAVLVCNGRTGSSHAANFNMGAMVALLQPREGIVYFLTEPAPELAGRRDVIFTDDLTERRPPETDLNAISYLSTFCRVILGRCSGAQMPTQTRANWDDPGKTLVCFTDDRNGACFVLNPEGLGLRMRVHWANARTPDEGATELLSVLNGL